MKHYVRRDTVKLLCEQRGVSLARMARTIGTTPRHMTNLLKNFHPDSEKIIDIARFLQVAPEDLNRECEVSFVPLQ